MMKRIITIICCIAFIFSCKENVSDGKKYASKAALASDNPHLHFINGDLYFDDELYSGPVWEQYPDKHLKSRIIYLNGKENGLTETFYPDGSKESARFYTNGEKDSIHRGWWPGGAHKFEYHFKKGNYDGAFTEWYSNGQMFQRILYANGKELSGQGWRENGKLFQNFIWKGNRRYGLVNPNMCYGIEKGEVKY